MINAPHLFLAAACLVFFAAGCSSPVPSGEAEVRIKARPDPVMQLPPLKANEAEVHSWISTSGLHWEQTEIAAATRKLVCMQLMPYSGLPGIHLFVYEEQGESMSLLFCAIVSTPPHFGKPLTFGYDRETNSVRVTCGDIKCLDISLATL
jgi:hypothetical protein